MPMFTVTYIADPVYATARLPISARNETEAYAFALQAYELRTISSWGLLGLSISNSPNFKLAKLYVTHLGEESWIADYQSEVARPIAHVTVESEFRGNAKTIADSTAKQFYWSGVPIGDVVKGPFITATNDFKRLALTTLTATVPTNLQVGVPSTTTVSVATVAFEPPFDINPVPLPGPVGFVRVSVLGSFAETVYQGVPVSITLTPKTASQSSVPFKCEFYGTNDSNYDYSATAITESRVVLPGTNILTVVQSNIFALGPQFYSFMVRSDTSTPTEFSLSFFLGSAIDKNLVMYRNLPTNQDNFLVLPLNLDSGSHILNIVSMAPNFATANSSISFSV